MFSSPVGPGLAAYQPTQSTTRSFGLSRAVERSEGRARHQMPDTGQDRPQAGHEAALARLGQEGVGHRGHEQGEEEDA